MSGIAESWSRAGLDLDRQQTSLRLDDEVHFFADGRAPVTEFRAVKTRVAPSQQVVEHQVFQMCSFRFRRSGKMQGTVVFMPCMIIIHSMNK